ncbi:RagB/SusD family nutrient uptake outer membrane protein [Mariniflexile litorale]|uniref:RagB/SusD family nutrient uptake outer membrane protein n=1 Tax=Mariniflexile litorale TaxID=3045158 RepID=A0AAU7EHT3_9FLAO|nr:RagB/SusD family nutrient uptake outer membrane protein [Mariniflexile sp. KMM 9835]MDQ8211922.1 RagB/SusD family nutrient uptake outer membrane protein [Mariniflexile sp. KMM 9835]
MNKYIYKTVLIVVLAIGLWACSDEFLDKQPTDALSSETFWASESDGELALTGVYGRLQERIVAFAVSDRPRNYIAWDAATDDAYQTYDYGWRQIIDGTMTPSTGGTVGLLYGICYNGIATANTFLANADRLSENGVSTDLVNQWKGEVHFIRAFWYYTLAVTYGDVPLRIEPSSVENQDIEKSTQAQIFAQVETDLGIAITNLAERNFDDGHANKAAANALLARALLYQGKYAEAADAAEEAILGGSFSLTDDYSAMFADATQENNNEVMFSIKTNHTTGETHAWGGSLEAMIAGWGAIHPTKDFVDSFEAIDGLPITSSPYYDENNPMENRDPRLSKYVVEGSLNPDFENQPLEGFSWIKWLSPATIVDPKNPPATNGTDAIIIRYADALLMYAEGKIESNNIDASVLDAINQVRARAYGVAVSDVGNYPAITTTNQAELRTIIRNERRHEFGLEGLRYFDLKRWGIAEQVLNGLYDPFMDNERIFLPKHMKLPLPQSAIDKNENLDQNPDYK